MATAAQESAYNLGVDAFRKKDYAAARRHWSTSVTDDHDATAENNLGYLLYHGLGGALDADRAVALWRDAAQRGEREAQLHLGQAYEDGKGVERSVVRAYAWYRCAGAGVRATRLDDDPDAEIVRDAERALAKLLPTLSPEAFEAAEKLAKTYVADYARPVEE